MKTIIPLHGEIGKVLEGVVVDLKRVPPSLINRLQLHFVNGASAEVNPINLADIVEDAEMQSPEMSEITAIEVDLHLGRITKALHRVSREMSAIMTQALESDDDNSRDTK